MSSPGGWYAASCTCFFFHGLPQVRVNELMHEYGLNVRFMGHVLIQMTRGNPAHMLLLVEMIARVLKMELRAMLRRKASELKMMADDPHKSLVAAFFDLVFADSRRSEQFWNGFVCHRLVAKFGVSRETWSDFPDSLRAHVMGDTTARGHLFTLLCSMAGVVFVASAAALVASAPTTRLKSLFSYDMVQELVPVIRQLDFVAESRGSIYQARGTEHESRGFFSSAKHFYGASMTAFRSALSRSPTNSVLLRNTGEVVFKLAR